MKLKPWQYKQLIKICFAICDYYEGSIAKKWPKALRLMDDYHPSTVFVEAIYGTLKGVDNAFTKAFS